MVVKHRVSKFAFVVIAMALGAGLVITPEVSNNAAVLSQRTGAQVYSEHCATCHGLDGRANTKRGKRKRATNLRKSRISYSKGIRVITNGKGRMPEFKSDLTTDEIRAVNTYVRGFRER